MVHVVKYIKLLFIAIICAACSENQGTPYNPTVIAGTVIENGNRLVGMVTDSKSGQGIEGVRITDGYSWVSTDMNGVYQMPGNDKAQNVYYTKPDGYRFTLSQAHAPVFYASVDLTNGELCRRDFVLVPKDTVSDSYSFIASGDPQVGSSSQIARFRDETIPDMASTVDGMTEFKTEFAVTAGDIVFNQTNLFQSVSTVLHSVNTKNGFLPFLQCIGNHDHLGIGEEEKAVRPFVTAFGPTDYSFDEGKVHFIVMDDVISTGGYYSSSSANYTAGFLDRQMEWVRQDILSITDRESKMAVLVVHIPLCEGSDSWRAHHYKDILSLLTSFREAHIISAHLHYPENYIHGSFVCRGGESVYEHVLGTACGAWWACNICTDGTPNGYHVFNVEGNRMKSWRFKGTGLDPSRQMRIYDGDANYAKLHDPQTSSAKYAWTTYFAPFKGCLIAEVWDGDERDWEIYLIDGGKRTRMNRLTEEKVNECAAAYFYLEKKHDSGYLIFKRNMWYAPRPVSDDWSVEAVHTMPSSGEKFTFTRGDITVDYSEF